MARGHHPDVRAEISADAAVLHALALESLTDNVLKGAHDRVNANLFRRDGLLDDAKLLFNEGESPRHFVEFEMWRGGCRLNISVAIAPVLF